MTKATVSKYMQDLASKYGLDVKATTEKGDYGSTYKVYHFTGNLLANFEALVAEAEQKGYSKSGEFTAALVKL